MTNQELKERIDAMMQTPHGSAALRAAAKAHEARERTRAPNEPDVRWPARQELVAYGLEILEHVGTSAEIRRQMFSAAAGQKPHEGEDDDLRRVFSPEHAKTKAGQSNIKIATARMFVAMAPVLGSAAAAAAGIAGDQLARDAGFVGPFGEGSGHGTLFETASQQGVDPARGLEYMMQISILGHAGRHFGHANVAGPAADISMAHWAEVARWVRRSKRFRGKTWDAATIKGWATDTSIADSERAMPRAKVFEQALAQGAADRAAGRVDHRLGCRNPLD